jgi:hypothetical protein
MLESTARTCSVVLACAICCVLLGASVASAGTPATVTVRVLGPAPNYEALTALTQVTTTTTPVTKDEGSCSGTSAAGALELATQGDWEGAWSAKYSDYEVTAIDGRGFPFEEGASADYYWSFWLNNKYAEYGVCEPEMEQGEQVLFVPACYGTGCPPAAPGVLALEAPATAEVGTPTTVTVLDYPEGGGEPQPLRGAVITGWGSSAETDATGRATLTFPGDATYTLRAAGAVGEEPKSIPGEALVCAHTGNDGTCGTTAPGHSTGSSAPAGTDLQHVAPYTGPYAVVAAIGDVRNRHTYSPGNVPRVITGTVSAHTAVTSISLRLRRSYHRHCWAYSGKRERLERVRCGRGRYFQVASGGDSFSYLLPSRLPRGRYVLDIRATDAAGNQTTLARGTSRVVFYVS